eukprot:9486030-Pyramimonas_sp.AAC.1
MSYVAQFVDISDKVFRDVEHWAIHKILHLPGNHGSRAGFLGPATSSHMKTPPTKLIRRR